MKASGVKAAQVAALRNMRETTEHALTDENRAIENYKAGKYAEAGLYASKALKVSWRCSLFF